MTYVEKVIALQAKINTALSFLNEEQALNFVDLFKKWNVDQEYKVDERVNYNNTLYKCLQAHTSQADWTPDTAVSLWAKVLSPNPDVIYEWEQPESTNPYMKGDKVTYNGKTYESTIDNNVWAPDVYGWTEVV